VHHISHSISHLVASVIAQPFHIHLQQLDSITKYNFRTRQEAPTLKNQQMIQEIKKINTLDANNFISFGPIWQLGYLNIYPI
jgi:hypothetical protein